MDEAIQTIAPQPSTVIAPVVRARMGRAVRFEAMRSAIVATKRAYQARGVKTAQLPYRQIVAAAEGYVLSIPS
jgi:hypothetical protein